MRGSVQERFEAKYVVDPSGCWLWTAYRDPNGYGSFTVKGIHIPAHRVSYELYVGPIPKGLHMDHLCRNPPCVNPSHLEPVTRRENIARGIAWDWNRGKTHCPSGHPYDDTNTYRYKGERLCRSCRREQWKVRDAKRRPTHCPQGHEYTPENTILISRLKRRRCRTCGWPPSTMVTGR